MLDGYFKGEEIESDQPYPEYTFILPNDKIFSLTLPERLAAWDEPKRFIYKRQIVTKRVAYYKYYA